MKQQIIKKQQIVNLVAEIEGWNNGDKQTCLETRDYGEHGGNANVDLDCTKARAKVISQLSQLVSLINSGWGWFRL